MKQVTCDECLKESGSDMQIHLRGYYPTNRAGILLSESFKELDFCSHGCFVQWMRGALKHEK